MSQCNKCEGTEICCSQPASISGYEAKRLKKLGATIGRKKGKWVLNPDYETCHFLSEGKCSIYQCRPEVCKKFTCEAEGSVMWVEIEKMAREMGSITLPGGGIIINPKPWMSEEVN